MKKAFTLIELLVVVLIIGILSEIALPQYQLAVTKARFMNGFQMALSLRRAQELYFLSNNVYAMNVEDLDWRYPSCSVKSGDVSMVYCSEGIFDNIVGSYELEVSRRIRLYFTISAEPSIQDADVRLEVFFSILHTLMRYNVMVLQKREKGCAKL